MFSKILIANRGEIAVRIIRACKEMGIATVAVYSEADRNALHVALADENICIGPSPAKDSYLNEERIISAALATKANAIHPGYGFLSENAHFATLCRDNGIAFIGPSAEQMDRLSDKTGMKRLAEDAGLKTIPGTAPLSSVAEAIKAADRIGYPVMLKARSGGGGRGIRLAQSSEELRMAFPNAVAEAEAAFGDGAVYIEKCITPAHHIEVQILADETGNVIALGERDCSIQRHHQKLLEETPSPAVSMKQRKKLLETVEIAIRKIGYTGAGTLEFLMDSSGNFWFMEMNVRLQVEHGVTESLTGIDLVKWQIRIAAGVDAWTGRENPFPVFAKIDDCDVKVDVVVDFSNAGAADALLDWCVRTKTPVVLCTTGLSPEQLARVEEAAGETAVLKSANMSVGINLLLKLLKEAAPKLAAAGFDIEIVEKHHNQKLDAPSGTAVALADAVNEACGGAYHYVYDRSQVRQKRDGRELGISAVRGGTIVGDHDVIFAGTDEVVTFEHRAYSRAVFGKGAIQAAKFLAGKPAGRYDMSDVIG